MQLSHVLKLDAKLSMLSRNFFWKTQDNKKGTEDAKTNVELNRLRGNEIEMQVKTFTIFSLESKRIVWSKNLLLSSPFFSRWYRQCSKLVPGREKMCFRLCQSCGCTALRKFRNEMTESRTRLCFYIQGLASNWHYLWRAPLLFLLLVSRIMSRVAIQISAYNTKQRQRSKRRKI